MRHMHVVCVAVHVTGLGRGFNSFLWGDYHLAVCGEVGHPHGETPHHGPPTWRNAGPPPKSPALVHVRELKQVTWAAAEV